ncbi:MAG: AAA family ATPase [Clostridia bacterium]|nr:AAA family ATPase [Clostridia bacterium]MDY5554223.1 AAA family ATPase [Blautia sp.]
MRRKCTETLLRWKKNLHRKPLILQGIRQSGKTWLLRDFGTRQYKNTIYINLETDRSVRDYLSVPRQPQDVLLFLETYCETPLYPEDSLLILDNLQCVPGISTLLLSISLYHPQYHITAIERGFLGKYDENDFEVVKLYPLDFEEFLWANSEFGLSKEIRAHYSARLPMGKELHAKALSQFQLYLVIGGMPLSILEYRKEKKLLMVPDVQQKILDLFLADIAARASEGTAHHIRKCWLSIPSQLGRSGSKFQYGQVSQNGTARLYQKPIRWLTDMGYACLCPMYKAVSEKTSSFHLYFPDTGLCTRQLSIPAYVLLTGEETPATRACVENFLAQQFNQNGFSLSCWSSQNQAEVPFVLQKNNECIAVDYRLTPRLRKRSLSRMKDLFPADHMFLISTEDFRTKESYDIIPFYATFCI